MKYLAQGIFIFVLVICTRLYWDYVYEPKVITETVEKTVYKNYPAEDKMKECQEKGWDYTLDSKMVCSVSTPCYYVNYEKCTKYSEEWFGTGEEIFWIKSVNTN